MSETAAGKTFALFNNSLNQKIISTIAKSNNKTLLFPTLETKINKLKHAQIEIINNLINFDWIIFTDVLAVDYFLELLEENNIDSFELDEIRVCAPFESISDRLRFAQLHADVIPNSENPNAIREAIQNYVSLDDLKFLKLLIVKEQNLFNSIKKTFDGFVNEISELAVYQICDTSESETLKLKLLLKNGAADDFIISAPEDLIALKYIFNEEPFEMILSEVNIVATNNLILQTLFEHKLNPSGLFQLSDIDKV